MTRLLVPVGEICDNPYQSPFRGVEIEGLMASIQARRESLPESRGLISVPVGRMLLDGDVVVAAGFAGALKCGAEVQIAVGHRRRMAFSNLAVGDDFFSVMPVDFRPLSDQEMADLAWTENQERLDVSPPDKALALKAALSSFGWTQEEIGERWGLSQSAVSNLLRLLDLPREILGLMRSGEISERHGRALLPVLQVDDRADLLFGFLSDVKGEIVTVSGVEERVRGWLLEMSRPFRPELWDFEAFDPPAVPDGRAGPCAACDQVIRVGREKRCRDTDCHVARTRFFRYTVLSPEVARRYFESRGAWVAFPGSELGSWVRCVGCSRSPGNFPSDAEWLKSSASSVICPECAERAGLAATLDEMPDPPKAPASDGWSPSFAPPSASEAWASDVAESALAAASMGPVMVGSEEAEVAESAVVEEVADAGAVGADELLFRVVVDVQRSGAVQFALEECESDSALAAWLGVDQEELRRVLAAAVGGG